MKIAIGSDHGGFALKEKVYQSLLAHGWKITDFGTDSEESCDYPIYAQKVAEAVASGEYDRGILLCGTGIGISIAANKVAGIRCALVSDCYSARVAREHNNSNILAMGGRVLGVAVALDIVNTWLKSDFEGGRHKRRVDQITALEK
jgi:ribose 5-phosphate isomerase B